MIVSLIADYESADYRLLLNKLRMLFENEHVLDLSRHKGNDWKKRDNARIDDIRNSHVVVVSSDWQEHADVRHDLDQAQKLKKEVHVYVNDKLIPFSNYSMRI